MADNENVSLADNTNESQTSATESQIMSGEIIHSTPVPTNRADENQIVKMMQTLFNIQNNKFDEKFSNLDEKFSNLDEKFSEQKNEIRKIQNDLNVQFDEVKKEIQEQGCIYDKRLSEIETRLGEIELENEKVIDKLKSSKDDRVSSSGNDDLNNGFTSDNNDNRSKKMVVENDCVDVELSLIHI